MNELSILKCCYLTNDVTVGEGNDYSVKVDGEEYHPIRLQELEKQFEGYTRAFLNEKDGETLFVDVYTVHEGTNYLITFICQLHEGIIDVFSSIEKQYTLTRAHPNETKHLVEKIWAFVENESSYRLVFATQNVTFRDNM